jgi:hypothetical protein
VAAAVAAAAQACLMRIKHLHRERTQMTDPFMAGLRLRALDRHLRGLRTRLRQQPWQLRLWKRRGVMRQH